MVATFNETHETPSREYVAEQGIVMPKLSNTFKNFC